MPWQNSYPRLTKLPACRDELLKDIKGKPLCDVDQEWDEGKNEIPIYQGSKNWRSFGCSLEKYVVVKATGTGEDVQFVGQSKWASGGTTVQAFVAPDGDNADKPGKPEAVDLRVCFINDLDVNAYSVDIWARAYDRRRAIFKKFIDDASKDVARYVQGTSVIFTAAPNTSADISALVSRVIKSLTTDEVGTLSPVLKVSKREWNCDNPAKYAKAEWIGYRLILFGGEKDPKEEQKHAYLTLWKYQLSLASSLAYLNGQPKGGGELA